MRPPMSQWFSPTPSVRPDDYQSRLTAPKERGLHFEVSWLLTDNSSQALKVFLNNL